MGCKSWWVLRVWLTFVVISLAVPHLSLNYFWYSCYIHKVVINRYDVKPNLDNIFSRSPLIFYGCKGYMMCSQWFGNGLTLYIKIQPSKQNSCFTVIIKTKLVIFEMQRVWIPEIFLTNICLMISVFLISHICFTNIWYLFLWYLISISLISDICFCGICVLISILHL